MPTSPTNKRRIGADLLRYVILGGCNSKSFHEYGLVLTGAYIEGELNLTMAEAKGATGLINCYFEDEIQAFQTRFKALNLMGSNLAKGIFAQGCCIEGSLIMSQGFVCEGQVRLSSAIIHGNLDCSKSSFWNSPGQTLNLQGAFIGGNVFLADKFFSQGEVRILGAIIKGQLDCSLGHFCNEGRTALTLRSAEVKEFKWQTVTECEGTVDLGNTSIGTLLDNT